MSQLSIFDPKPPAYDFLDDLGGDPDGLRWFQREVYDAVYRGLETNRSVLAVLATGLGKTETFGAVAKHWPHGAVLVLAHRDELVQQARARLERMTGLLVEVEQGDWHASNRARIVVGSTQSVMRQNRLDRMGRDRFSLIIPDEAHHYVSPTYMRILDFFASAKVFGVTATPDRADEMALGQIFDDVVYVMDISEGIEAGYLVPLRGHQVILGEINLDRVGKSGKDLSAIQLDEEMQKHVHGIVHKVFELEPSRQGIAFFPGVKSAEYAAAAFNAVKPDCAIFIDGKTDPLERREAVRQYQLGRYQFLCNCQVFDEGFDAPPTANIIHGAPTLSRAKYAQRTGRGTRTFGADVDSIEGKGGAPARRALVAASRKPDCVLMDFVGNSTKHALVSPEDILGGNYSEAEIAAAKKKRAPGGDIQKSLAAARKELQELAAKTKARVTATVRPFDPFNVFGMTIDDEDRYAGRFGGKPLTTGQREALERVGVPNEDLDGLSKHAASRLLEELNGRRKKGLATYKQQRQLLKFGIADRNISFDRASAGITYIVSKGWGKNGSVEPGTLNEILYHQRQPGEDG